MKGSESVDMEVMLNAVQAQSQGETERILLRQSPMPWETHSFYDGRDLHKSEVGSLTNQTHRSNTHIYTE